MCSQQMWVANAFLHDGVTKEKGNHPSIERVVPTQGCWISGVLFAWEEILCME